MSEQPRFLKPTVMHEIVVRTIKGRRLFRPVAEVTRAVLNVLGRSLALFAVPLCGFVYLSNHKHLLTAPTSGDLLRAFIQHLNRNTAAVVKKLTGWTESVWARCRPIPILDDLASIRRLRYLLSNGVKEGLVEHPLAWPGPSCAASLANGAPIETEWIVHPPGARKGTNPTIVRNTIELTPLPVWAHLPLDERAARARAMMDDIAESARLERAGRPVLGVEALCAQDPFQPTELDITPAPLAHTTDPDLLAAYLEERKGFLAAHRTATDQQRRTGRAAVYPPCGFPAAIPFLGDDDE
jgi:hypothetical protein